MADSRAFAAGLCLGFGVLGNGDWPGPGHARAWFSSNRTVRGFQMQGHGLQAVLKEFQRREDVFMLVVGLSAVVSWLSVVYCWLLIIGCWLFCCHVLHHALLITSNRFHFFPIRPNQSILFAFQPTKQNQPTSSKPDQNQPILFALSFNPFRTVHLFPTVFFILMGEICLRGCIS